jgi:predicted transcriptional regulator
MSVAETSIIAYDEHKENGKVGKQSILLLAYMKPNVFYSRRELAYATGIDLSAVCGRINELVKFGLVIEGAKRPCYMTKKLIQSVGKK